MIDEVAHMRARKQPTPPPTLAADYVRALVVRKAVVEWAQENGYVGDADVARFIQASLFDDLNMLRKHQS